MSVRWEHLETLFLEALERRPDERGPYLLEACDGDEELRAEVEAMLRAHEGSELRVESRLLAVEEEPSLAGRRIGPYRLLSLIGRGGMGEVHLAERDDDLYHRRVAIKLVRPGPRSSLRRRFAREREILARLIHPHVATLYDGGITDDGRPYLVMEHVEGLPITEYCDRHRLDVDARLELFLTVCEAVQHAHSALVIHRDLKPSNILVDARGTVKLLDFGIAKLLEDEEAGAAPTVALDRVLTPEHAAPEQIRGEEPTTATDVYGLGVLLCELLVGERPLRFPTRSPVEIDRIAREVEAPPPSRLWAQLDRSERDRRAELRSATAEAVARRLRGDLDAICRRCLRKESEARYRGPAELMADLRRHRHRRPVRAMEGNRLYFARKFVHRHRTSLGLSAMAFVILSGFLVLSLVQARQVRVERDRARQQSERAEVVLDHLVGLFESARSELQEGPDLLDVGELLERGEETAAMLTNQPAVQARMYETLAEIHASRGQLDRALDLLVRARDMVERPRDDLRLAHGRARLIARRDGPDVGRPLLRASLGRHRELLGPRHPDVAQALQDLAAAVADPDEERALLEEALRIQEAAAPDDDRGRASLLNALAQLEVSLDRHEPAQSLLEEADRLLEDELPENSPARMTVRHNLCSVFVRTGRWEQAEPLQREIVAQRRRAGPTSDRTAGALEAHGVTLAHLGRHRESGEAFAEALAIFESTLGPGHWRIANGARNVGQLLALQGRYDEALPHLERAMEMGLGGGPGSIGALYLRGQRAMVRLGQGRVEEASAELREVAAGLAGQAEGRGARYAADSLVWLGIAELRGGRARVARTHFTRAGEIRAGLYDAQHPRRLEVSCALALVDTLDGGGAPARRTGSSSSEELARSLEGYRAWGLAHPLMLELLDEHLP